MDVVALSRLQFAVTSMFHFLFVPLTLGLSILTAWMEWQYVGTNDVSWLRQAKFWGRLFVINFALGIVTGITLEFQFGTNWAEYARYVGDIFGAPLAIEATLAFFLESVFIGVWIFGWNKVSKRAHAMAITIVAVATNLSAIWILLANGWMQHPVGFALRNNRAEMVDFVALVTNATGWRYFFHTVSGACLLAAFFVMGVSSWHLLRKNEIAFFSRSFKASATYAVIALVVVLFTGERSAVGVARTQPEKLAAMEAQWETVRGAPYTVLSIPLPDEERSIAILAIPKLLSLLAFHDPNAEVQGLKAFAPADRPPVLPVFIGYRIMLGIGLLLTLLTIAGFFAGRKEGLESKPWLLRAMVLAIPLPYLAIEFGWLVAEMGRQPWIVYHVMRTADAASKAVSASQVVLSLSAFVVLYSVLGIVDVYLLARYAKRGPDAPATAA
jgi:cytochrome d ubiquinol oxidase subunit I